MTNAELSEDAVLEIQNDILPEAQGVLADLWQAAHEADPEKVRLIGEDLARLGHRLSVGAQTVIASAFWAEHQ
jgi:hypothetical protein